VKAFIVAKGGRKPSLKEVTEFMRERIESYMVPRDVEIVDELPKTVSGKIQRHVLK